MDILFNLMVILFTLNFDGCIIYFNKYIIDLNGYLTLMNILIKWFYYLF